MKNRHIILAIVFLALASMGLSTIVEAVSPAPDGGYPGGNTAEGQSALLSRTTGGFNTAVGWLSLRSVTSGNYNTGVGAGALSANTGDENTATGTGALLSDNSGFGNTADGAFALVSNTVGIENTAMGHGALQSNIDGNYNTAVGRQALFSNTGCCNTAVGQGALRENTTGAGNIALGHGAGLNVTTAGSVICIGADGNNVENSCYIGNIFNATSSGGTAVYVNTNGRLGTSTSSRRFKENIKAMDHTSETLFALKPVTFRYKNGIDPEGAQGQSQFGLVAEDVEKVNPDLIVRDKEGKPYSVRYDQVNAMLLNEFLKEHRKVQELEAKVARQQKDSEANDAKQREQIQALTARLDKQDAKIEKVTNQIERRKPSSQIVSNDQ